MLRRSKKNTMTRKTPVAITLGVALVMAASVGAATIDFVSVGPPGNAGESSGYGEINGIVGAVAYEYEIGKYEVTAGQYAEFLNAKAATDTYGLYDSRMLTDAQGCGITQSGSSGSFTYSAASANLPVNFVDWGDAARFANWVNNGQATGDTETGAYTLNGAMTASALGAVTRNGSASTFIASEDEWYKAAFYNPGTTSYFDYATSTDTVPTAEAPAGGVNSANYSNAVANVTDVGAYTASVNPYGTFDQSGNVEEWTDTTFVLPIQGTPYHLYRGGGFDDSQFSVQAMGRTGTPDRTDERSALGFRLSAISSVTGDFDGDDDVDADDIDILCANMGGALDPYDLDGDLDVDEDDMIFLVENLVEWDNGVDTGTGTKRGDFNLDGLVNATDLAIMNPNFGLGPKLYAEGNANCDTVVNGTDLAILAGNIGFAAPTGAVPEPITMGLLAMGGVALLRRKHR